MINMETLNLISPYRFCFHILETRVLENTNESDKIWSVEEPISDYSIMTSKLTLIITI